MIITYIFITSHLDQETSLAEYLKKLREVEEVISAIDKMMILSEEQHHKMTSNNRKILETRSWEDSVTILEDVWYKQLEEQNERLIEEQKKK